MRSGFELLGPLLGELSLQAAVWGTAGGVLGFLLALVLSWVIHRQRWLRRTPGAWNILAKLSYLILVAAFVLAGGIGGALHGTQRVVDRKVSSSLEPLLAARMPALRGYLAGYLAPMAKNSVITVRDMLQPMLRDLGYQPRSAGWLEQRKAHLINEIILRGGALALTQAFQQSMRLLPQFLPTADDRGQDQLVHFTVDTALKMLAATGDKVDFSPLDQSVPKVFAEAVQHQIDSLYKGIYIGLVIKLVIVLALIAAEMLFYFRYWVPRRAQLATPAVADPGP
jgi:hypothetical protein